MLALNWLPSSPWAVPCPPLARGPPCFFALGGLVGRELGGQLVLLVAGVDRPLFDFLNTGLAQEGAHGTMPSLLASWIELKR